MVTPAVAIVLIILALFMCVAILCYLARKDLRHFFVLADQARLQRRERQPDIEGEHAGAATRQQLSCKTFPNWRLLEN